jgi:hypothetical protein
MENPTRAAVIDGLQQLVDALRADERAPLPYGHIDFFPHGMDGEALAAFVAALEGENWQQQVEDRNDPPGGWLTIKGRVKGLPVYIYARANEVCEPIPPQPVIERKCLALDALLAKDADEARCA